VPILSFQRRSGTLGIMTMPRTPPAKLTKPGIPNAPKKPKATTANATTQEETVVQEEIAVQEESQPPSIGEATNPPGRLRSVSKPLRTSGRNLNLTSHETTIQKAKKTIVKLQEGNNFTKESKQDLAALLEKMIEHMDHQQASTSQDNPDNNTIAERLCNIERELTRLNGIEQELQELKASMSESKTWAQIAATKTPPNPTGMAKRQQLENAKKERSRYEVTLTAASASEEIKKELATKDPKEITTRCQQAIDATDMTNKAKVLGINRLANDSIRLQCKSAEDAQQIQTTNIDWNKAFKGLKVHKPQYGVVVHGVPTEAIDLSEEHENIIREWEEANDARGIKIAKVVPLRRQTKYHRPAAHRSLVIFTEDPQAADKCITMGFLIDNQKCKTERYAPQCHINQCYNCYEYRHRATLCKRKQKCGKCGSENHHTNDCTSTEHKCVNCNGKHEAWHPECPAKNEEARRLANVRMETSPYFTS
jgi:hypothetical protein